MQLKGFLWFSHHGIFKQQTTLSMGFIGIIAHAGCLGEHEKSL